MANIIKIDLMMYLASLHQGQWFGFDNSGNREYENVIVHDDQYTLPTKEVCEAAVAKNQADYDALDYARKRKEAYPDIYDYMDGIVKNDQTQINKYIADSQAVKVRYPKG